MKALEELLGDEERYATFHDAQLMSVHVDYVAKRWTGELDMWVGNPDAEDEAGREKRRHGRLDVEGLAMWSIEPPDVRYTLGEDGLWLTHDGPLAECKTETAKQLAQSFPTRVSWFFYFTDLNMCAYLAGENATFTWVQDNAQSPTPQAQRLSPMSAPQLIVRRATLEDSSVWLELRRALWPEEEGDSHEDEIARFFKGTLKEPLAVLLADEAGKIVGFAEINIRGYAEGCSTDRIGFLEGWYVIPDARRQGVGRALVEASEDWARDQGCTEFASDAVADNEVSAAAHQALGFEEVEIVRCFRKKSLQKVESRICLTSRIDAPTLTHTLR